MYSGRVVIAPMPKAVGRYQILDRLAVGGMAELFKATLTGDHGFEKLVAIKKILPHLATDKSFVEMFIDEARITAQLDHRHIVQVFELGTDADTPYIAMQYVDGLDVLALLRECARAQIRLPAELAALIARDVLDALDYAHNALDSSGRPLGIIHRDISPGNVLLSWRGDIKLTDFGIARAAERRHKTEAGTLKGKYGYMSPEQVSGSEVDARSDLFSVGILLAEMVMARRLFTSTNDLDILLMVRDARLDRLHKYASEFPVELRVLTTRALQRRPEDRWQSAAQFRDALDEWIRRTTGVSSRELATLLGRVINAPTADLEGVPAPEADDPGAMSGPMTRMSQAQAEIEAARARAAYIAGEAIPTGVSGDTASSGVMQVSRGCRDPVGAPRGRRDRPAPRAPRRVPARQGQGHRHARARGPRRRAQGGVLRRRPAAVRQLQRRGRAARQVPDPAGRAHPPGAGSRPRGGAPPRRPARRHPRRPRHPRSARGVPPARQAGRGQAHGGVLVGQGPLHVDAAPPEPVEGALAPPRCVPRDRRGRGPAR
jgi:hypothetical protein